MQIGTQKNGGWRNCEMVDHFYSVAIQVNSFHNIMADKTDWWINEYSGVHSSVTKPHTCTPTQHTYVHTDLHDVCTMQRHPMHPHILAWTLFQGTGLSYILLIHAIYDTSICSCMHHDTYKIYLVH